MKLFSGRVRGISAAVVALAAPFAVKFATA